METFSAGSCIKYGWETFKKRPWFFIGATLLFFVVIIVITSALDQFVQQGGILSFIATLGRLVLEMLIGMGSISFALKAHDDVEHVSISDFLRVQPFWKYTGTSLLFGIVFVIGLILVVIPGIIWAIMFGYATFLVIDKGLWPIEALKESRRITRGSRWELLVLALFSILIMIAGVICLGVGFLVAYPVIVIANVHALRTLQLKAGPVSVTVA